ncbi:serine hydrolase domain-containing protein [Bacteroidota bacterium]
MKNILVYLLFILIFNFTFYSCEEDSMIDNSLPLRERIDRLVEPAAIFGNPGAIIIGVIQDGEKSIYSYGDAGLGFGPPRSNTIFEIGSNTKTFVATLLSDFIDDGLLSLDDSINQFFPDYVNPPTFNGLQITLRHLVTHSSGLPREAYNFNMDINTFYSKFTNEDFYTFLNDISIQAYPFDDYTSGNELKYLGTKFRYSNIGVGILGHILERVSEKKLEELIEERICSKLNMPDTKTITRMSGEQVNRIPKAYNINQYEQALPRDWGRLLGPGSLYSTMDDMLNYMAANMSDTSALSSPMQRCHEIIYTWEEICNEDGDFDETFPYKEADGIGMVWYVTHDNGDIIVEHGGDYNHHCLFKFNNTRKVGIVMFTNTPSISVANMADTILTWISE